MRIFNALKSLQGVINFDFKLAQLPLLCPYSSCINKRAPMLNVTFKTKNKGSI
ncbi:Mobile element protein [Candidatus Enterovibrio altilux]|uniref:Mobile element protein n=1 Tax=Candidatus Enterovibrio altilux TaxID=1927128 RepID=A0A291B6G0_9GAMM|nr:Mobile element protein [Candidatus Enterovibrio luxaltus]